MGRCDQDDLNSAVEAAQWLHRLKEPGAHLDRAPFEGWLAESRAHRREFFLISVTDVQMDSLRRHARSLKLDPPSDETILPFRHSGRSSSVDTPPNARRAQMHRPLRRAALVAYAAMIVAFVLGVLFTYGVGAGATVYGTDIGERRTVTLEDGTLIELNTHTRIEVAFTSSSRRVRLLEGEAKIDVGRDPRSFEVHAGAAIIRDVGTVFNVRLASDRLDVAVQSGEVSMTTFGGQNRYMTALSAGEAVAMSLKANAPIPQSRKLKAEEFERLTSWTQGLLLLNGERLGSVIADVNRYNVRQIQVLDPKVAELQLGGQMKAVGAEDFVQTLTSVFHIRALVPADPDEPIQIVGIDE